MERGGRRSGGVLIKKRSSSGCLILKKKQSDVIGNLPRSTSDSESSEKPLMAHYGNVGLKRDYPEDCFVGNSRERHRLEDEEDEEEESGDELLRRSYDGIGKKSYMGSAAQFGNTNRECGSASSSKYLDIERKRRRRPCLDKVVLVGGNEYMDFDRPIRVQGKNGVLKVMPKHNRVMRGGLPQSFTHVQAQKSGETGKIRVAIQSQTAVKTEDMLPPVRIHSNGGLKTPMKSQDSEDSDSSGGRLQKRIVQPHKVLKIEREKALPEAPTLPKTKEGGKVKRGSGTEKQRLRERIREMLLEAGWTIDYRPRRNRDYLDAVYISPRGTAYWSIIKAYEALLKQVNSGEKVAKPCEVGSAATLISDEILSQLTRKTKRKMENDMKRVEQCANDDSDGQGSLGDFTAPLDDGLTHVSLDLSG
ncbi:Acyl-CoA N-acyltransferase with RING/FYVE/PHD-type zinc finger protein [Hirschfeldia incana]|nr:Acyl-CoA N-acyltransferase with RING/FYVE/PHD-type zinc finger protein [Hirschfeldia incana]KAJ0232741.1 Acyl-CoA N-acyltransferase with RING/FYVE/PHD-type zinc finger protein [Hirschfeldia incana]